MDMSGLGPCWISVEEQNRLNIWTDLIWSELQRCDIPLIYYSTEVNLNSLFRVLTGSKHVFQMSRIGQQTSQKSKDRILAMVSSALLVTTQMEIRAQFPWQPYLEFFLTHWSLMSSPVFYTVLLSKTSHIAVYSCVVSHILASCLRLLSSECCMFSWSFWQSFYLDQYSFVYCLHLHILLSAIQ